MRVLIAAVGRLKKGPEQELVSRYNSRLKGTGKQLGINKIDTAEIPESRASNAQTRKADEADSLTKKFAPKTTLIAFDERGKSISSQDFADLVKTSLENGVPELTFLIGGPDGMSDTLRNQADRVISFGHLTLPHQLVRVLVIEQLYRATTILSGHPYHRD